MIVKNTKYEKSIYNIIDRPRIIFGHLLNCYSMVPMDDHASCHSGGKNVANMD